MKLSIGIVGLPNVGKSTLFNALLKKQVANVANYPFCTIEPNVGVIEVPDERLPVLAKIVNTTKIVPAVVEFYDIAGLVRGASKGEGLGNKFLSHIREVAAIVHVVRLFEDANVTHVSDKVNPVEDIKTIETELILADLETIEKSKSKNQKSNPQIKDQKELIETLEIVEKNLNSTTSLRNLQLTNEQKEFLRPLNLLTSKPVIYVYNVSEQQLQNPEEVKKKNALYLCAKLENEVLAFNEQEQKEFLQQYQLEETGLNRLIKKAYETLGLISFLTAGEKEVRAWTIVKGTLTPQAAGVIHTDFEKHFIKADVIPYQQFVDAGGWIKAREKGLVQTVGKDYVMREGEVVEFKVGV
jgi:GTP-binding protein YchF